jgi:hypothetical protein
MLKFLPIYGANNSFREKISEAGLRRISAVMLVYLLLMKLKNPYRQGLFELLRTANHKDGGVVTKGTPSGKPLHFRIQSSTWLSSIEIGLNESADRSRYIIFHFRGYKKGLPSIKTTKELSGKIYALSLWLWSQGVDGLADDIRNQKDDKYTDRSVDNYSPLVAIIALVTGRKDHQEIMNILLSQNSEALIKTAPDDEQALLDTILGTAFTVETNTTGARYPEKQQKTIAQIIESDDEDHWRQIERVG